MGDRTIIELDLQQGDKQGKITLEGEVQPDIIFQAGQWIPGMVIDNSLEFPNWIRFPAETVPREEAIFIAEVIGCGINEGSLTDSHLELFEDEPDLLLKIRWRVLNPESVLEIR